MFTYISAFVHLCICIYASAYLTSACLIWSTSTYGNLIVAGRGLKVISGLCDAEGKWHRFGLAFALLL